MKASQCLAAAAAAVLVLGSATALAKSPFAAMRLAEKLRAEAPKVAQAQVMRSECAQLAGNWQGTCTDDFGGTYESELSIEQYRCSEFTLDTVFLPIGGVIDLGWTTTQESSKGGAFAD